MADPDSCVLQNPAGNVECTGNQSAGVATGRTLLASGGTMQSPPITTIGVHSLGSAISPASGTPGIYLHSDAGSPLTLNAGTVPGPIFISATGESTGGIVTSSFGTPTATRQLFMWFLPSGAGGNGGSVTVNSYATVTTDGNESPGISARSRAGGYSQAVIDTLKSFINTNQGATFYLKAVEGDSTNIGKAVNGSNGGSFTLTNGASGISPTYTYNLSGMALDGLKAGQHIDTSITYSVISWAGLTPSDAVITLRITRLADGSLTVLPSTYFMEYGRAYEAANPIPYVAGSTPVQGQIPLQPDFDSYATRLLSDSAVGGIGGDVLVNAHGSITTKIDASLGQASYGILAQSKGGTGLGGSGGVFSGDPGNAGSAGGTVTVNNWAEIHTHGDGAHGIVATSSGGNGGRGGDTSFAGNGAAGGAGAKGGSVTVNNYAKVTTERDGAFGILAQSLGGRGGVGGDGGWLGGGGGLGGAGTINDPVKVDNFGEIITHGEGSHGILVQNIGGFGGSGGGAMGIVALGSSGGNAGAGGEARIHNTAKITTTGIHANALIAQSIGGGGGSAGGTTGLVAIGGDGTAGGNGGVATIFNSGQLTAKNLGAVGILAQSIGGGGGNGGDSVGLVPIGGNGATTSNGGAVSVTNQGTIESSGNAIFAESVGGGGGTGGSSVGWFGVGGDGGGGGDGGTVDVTNSGNLTTTGRNAAALFAQSVGGGGGNGGNVVAVGAFGSVAIGGSGGPGGDGKAVVARSTGGTIETAGVQSHGIYAQSLGGRGGNGGFAVAVAAGKGLAVSLAVGGGAGGGGDGAEVQVESKSNVVTHEEMAHGIYAQSVGGGGGTGGFAVAASGAIEGVAASFSVGGSGGDGGDGKSVDVGKEQAIGGKIETSGANASGILAQSIGGGGGYGGLSVAGNLSVGGSGGGMSFSLGGSGGDGGDGNAVKVNSAAIIKTKGERAYGIRAQSLGGGGGDGGLAVSGSIGGSGGGNGSPGTASLRLNVSVGGSAGGGGIGETVDTTISGGSIETAGKDAHGIFAQSIGGGGGNGGMAISGSLGLGANNANIGISVGGSGGSGGTGKKVTVSNGGSITTRGEAAFGIFAQSVGGGGGTGGASFDGNAIINKGKLGPNINIGFAFGGSGGAAGHGGEVAIANTGSIETFGISSHGIFAESVGGGGGQGGSARTMSITLSSGLNQLSTLMQTSFNLNLGGKGGAAGDGNAVTVNNWGSIVTRNADAFGIYAQSVGGGGGSGGEGAHGFPGIATFLTFADSTKFYEKVSLSMGGIAGAAGDGNTVTVNQHGSITAYEHGSHGIFAQSVGGGGGTGGVGMTGLTGTLGIGGAGGASGDGGKVDILASGNIDTHGASAYGVFAQSIGGGGGIAGNVDRGLSQWIKWTGIDHGVGVGIGIVRNSENGGNGGEVIVKGEGVVHTRGTGSVGIFAQSAGGGGGVAGDQSGWGVTGSAGGNGSGDLITIDWTGSIITDGAKAHGIYAQSAGGEKTTVHIYELDEDGNLKATPTDRVLELRQNLGKDVGITVRGSVVTKGAGSDAIYAQSEGAEGNGNITVKILNKGIVQGGSGTDSVGIHLVGGATNRIENSGTISTLEGMSGFAIYSDIGNDSIINTGTLVGSVQAGTGTNALTNDLGGVFNAGVSVNLGAGNTLTNSGTLSPGGANAGATTALTGNLIQNGSGSLLTDISLGRRTSDRLNVAGSAQLAGNIKVNPIDTGWARNGEQQTVVLSTSAGTDIRGLTLSAPPSPMISYALVYPNASDIAVASRINFIPGGLKRNTKRIASHIDAIQTAGGSSSLAPYVAALMTQPDEASLNIAYEKLGPGALGTLAAAAKTASLEFNDAMHSCRQRDGEFRFIREGECNWVRLGGSIHDQERNDQNPGYTQDVVTMAGGIQKALRENLHFGFAASYQQSSLNSVFSDVNGERFEGGLIMKQRFDATRLSLSLSAGYGHYNTRRLVDIATPGTYAQAKPSLWSTTLHGRISHDIQSAENAYIRPMLGLGISYVSRNAYEETGAGGANLRVEKDSDTFASLHPALEFGGESSFGDEGALLRHYVRVGMTQFLGNSERHVTASLEGAPSGVQPFTVITRSEKSYADLALGFDLLLKSGTTVRLEYAGQFSNSSSTNAIGVKLTMPF